jgi:hypothetical protein
LSREREQDEVIVLLKRIEQLLVNAIDKLDLIIERIGHERPRQRRALDIMREQGVVFESDLTRIKNPDSFFEYLSRHGVIVVEGTRERAAVTREFLNQFIKELSKCEGPEDAEEKLSGKYKRFYLFLRESGLLVYNSAKKEWNLGI